MSLSSALSPILGTVSFANPLGLWALLGVPAVVAIHFIQQRFRTVKISTMFLLENIKPVDVEGRRLDWIRNSAQLWLQILMVLLLSLILAAPEWAVPGSIQRVVLVLDSSYSVGAFYDSLQREAEAKLDQLAKRAERTEWVLRETDPGAGTLYSGLSRTDLSAAIKRWVGAPRTGGHSPAAALNDARRLAGDSSTIIFLTDHKQQIPDGIALLSIGRQISNWGLIGLRTAEENGEISFEALVRNYSDQEAVRSWWFETGGAAVSAKGEEHPLKLQAGGLTSIRAVFPPGADALTVAISGDEFALDDRLPILRPQRKKLRIFGERGELTRPFKKVIASLPDLERTQKIDEADIRLLVFSTPADIPSEGRGILFFTPEAGKSMLIPDEPIVADRSRLAEGLNWNSLVPGKSAPLSPGDLDQTLLWSGSIPLLLHRHGEKVNLLIVNLDAVGSNAFQTPSFIILLHRFLESLRPEIDRPDKNNYELRQPLRLARRTDENAVFEWKVNLIPSGGDIASLAAAEASAATANPPLFAPALPGFFTVTRSGETALSGAAHFADAAESDFKGFAAADIRGESAATLTSGRRTLGALMPLLLLMAGLLLLITWLSPGRKGSGRREAGRGRRPAAETGAAETGQNR